MIREEKVGKIRERMRDMLREKEGWKEQGRRREERAREMKGGKEEKRIGHKGKKEGDNNTRERREERARGEERYSPLAQGRAALQVNGERKRGREKERMRDGEEEKSINDETKSSMLFSSFSPRLFVCRFLPPS